MGQNGGRVLSGRAGNVRRRITLLSWEDAAALYRALSDAGVSCWVVGGWGVDALLGRQSRPHKDLDVLVLHESFRSLIKC